MAKTKAKSDSKNDDSADLFKVLQNIQQLGMLDATSAAFLPKIEQLPKAHKTSWTIELILQATNAAVAGKEAAEPVAK